MEEEKEYLPIDLSKNKCYATVEEMMRDCVSPEIMEEVARLVAASAVSRAKARIYREIMAGLEDGRTIRVSIVPRRKKTGPSRKK